MILVIRPLAATTRNAKMAFVPVYPITKAMRTQVVDQIVY